MVNKFTVIVLKTSVKAKSAQSYLEDPEISTLLHAAILFNCACYLCVVASVNIRLIQRTLVKNCPIDWYAIVCYPALLRMEIAGNSEWYLF